MLFVSHNMAAITEMADRALLLDAGSVILDGSVAEAVSTYLSEGARKSTYLRPFGPRGSLALTLHGPKFPPLTPMRFIVSANLWR